MTTPTFQELLTSQEARDRVECFFTEEGKGTHWMNKAGILCRFLPGFISRTPFAIWQGWLTEAASPPEPRVFKRVEYRPVLKGEGLNHPSVFQTKEEAENFGKIVGGMIACVRVEITATEGQFDD